MCTHVLYHYSLLIINLIINEVKHTLHFLYTAAQHEFYLRHFARAREVEAPSHTALVGEADFDGKLSHGSVQDEEGGAQGKPTELCACCFCSLLFGGCCLGMQGHYSVRLEACSTCWCEPHLLPAHGGSSRQDAHVCEVG